MFNFNEPFLNIFLESFDDIFVCGVSGNPAEVIFDGDPDVTFDGDPDVYFGVE